MIANDKIIFIHIPKTGGTSIVQYLEKFQPLGTWAGIGMPHAGVDAMPKSERDKVVICGTRNPWTWSLSCWYGNLPESAKPSPRMFYDWVQGVPICFARRVEMTFNGTNDGIDFYIRLEHQVQDMRDSFNQIYGSLSGLKNNFSKIQHRNVTFNSFVGGQISSGAGLLSDCKGATVLSDDRRKEFYDNNQDLIDLVGEKHKYIIDKFNYTPDCILS